MTNRSKLERASWIAGILSAVVAIVGLYFLFAPADKTPATSQVNINTGTGTVIGTATGSITINQSNNAVANDAEVTIKGRWSDSVAEGISGDLLHQAEAKMKASLCEGQIDCKIVHALVGKYSLVYASKEVTLLLYSSIDDDLACHACAPFISIFEFERRPTGWLHSQSDVAVFQWGSWGTMDTVNVLVKPIGPHTFGILFDLGYTQGGYTESAVAIWAKLSDTYQKVLHIPSALDDSGTTTPGQSKWDSKITFERSDLGLYSIMVATEGTSEGKRFHSKNRFEFNGVEYKAGALPDHLAPIDCIKKNFSGGCI